MKKKFISWLSFLAVFILTLQSCVHDEISSSSDPSSTTYTNKSLWKQDEVYINNVMKVYAEHEAEIKTTGETPFWDYATTVNNFDESYVAVPIVQNKYVISVMKVPRHGKKIYFYYTHEESDLKFFQGLIFAKYKKAKEPDFSKSATERIECKRQWISVFLPDNQSNPDGPGQWSSTSIIICKQLKEECISVVNEFGECDTGGGSGGYEYPGAGGGNPEPEEEETPCEKTKTLLDKPQIQDSITSMKAFAQTSLRKERGFQELKSGTLVNGSVTGNLQVNFGIGSNSLGTIHVHPLKGIAMFSAGDIMTFLHLLRQQDATSIGNAYGGMVSASGTYFINFTGTASDLPPEMTEAQEQVYTENLVIEYRKEYYRLLKNEGKLKTEKLSNFGLEKLFFDLLNKMGLSSKIELIKEDIGNTSTIQLDSSGEPVSNPC